MSYRVIRRILLRALLLVVSINTDSSQAQGAGPRLIIVTGGGLSKPIVLDNFEENIDLMRSISEDAGLTTKELAGRRYFELTFFSGVLGSLRLRRQTTRCGASRKRGSAGPVLSSN